MLVSTLAIAFKILLPSGINQFLPQVFLKPAYMTAYLSISPDSIILFSISFLRSRIQAGTLTFSSDIQSFNYMQSILQNPYINLIKPLMSKDEEIKMVVISHKPTEEQQMPEVDPLEQEIYNLKLTSNLLKEINFNSAVNKFDYLETLLAAENKKFNSKMSKSIAEQKELIKKVKGVQKITKQIKNQTTALNYPKLHVQLEQLKSAKEQVKKFEKLSLGMIKYLQNLDQKLSLS